MDLDILVGDVEARPLRVLLDALFAADENGGAQPLVHEGHGGAHDLLLLALGEDDALGIAAHPLEDALQGAGHRITPGREGGLIGVHVVDGLARDARLHGGLRHRSGHHTDEAGIEGGGNDIFAAEARAGAVIGGGHFIRHILARQHGQRIGGGDLHLHVDGGGAHVEGAAEDIGEAQHVIDLVGIVRPPGRHDAIVAHRMGLLRRDFRIRIGHGEDDGVGRHGLDHLRRQRALDRQAEEHVGAIHGLRQRAPVGDAGMG